MLAGMTVAPHERTIGQRSVAGSLRRSALVEAARALRRSDYLVIGASARFRAEQRRRTVVAARIGFILIAVTTLLDAILVLDPQPPSCPSSSA
jgi:hypothetical protein